MGMNFLGSANGAELYDARFVISPFPYDATASYGTGARLGPCRIIEASSQLELFDEELQMLPCRAGIHTLPFPDVPIEPEKAKKLARKTAEGILKRNVIPVFIGGDHSTSIGVIEAAAGIFHDLTVLHLDAHTDMRREYQGSRLSHACVARRASELCSIVQAGVRSCSEEEWNLIKASNSIPVTAAEIRNDIRSATEEIMNRISGKNIYVTIDVDCLDPSIMPATGTPEPGGLDWFELTHILKQAAARFNIIGFDIVELAPVPGLHFPEFTCARLIYKIIGYIEKFRA